MFENMKLWTRIAETGKAIVTERARVAHLKDTVSPKEWASIRVGETKRLYNLLEDRFVLREIQIHPGRTFYSQVKLVGTRRPDGTIERFAKPRIADWAEFRKDVVQLGDLKSSSTILRSVKGGMSDPVIEATLRSTSEIGAQISKERRIFDEALRLKRKIVAEVTDPVAQIRFEVDVAPEVFRGSKLSDYGIAIQDLVEDPLPARVGSAPARGVGSTATGEKSVAVESAGRVRDIGVESRPKRAFKQEKQPPSLPVQGTETGTQVRATEATAKGTGARATAGGQPDIGPPSSSLGPSVAAPGDQVASRMAGPENRAASRAMTATNPVPEPQFSASSGVRSASAATQKLPPIARRYAPDLPAAKTAFAGSASRLASAPTFGLRSLAGLRAALPALAEMIIPFVLAELIGRWEEGSERDAMERDWRVRIWPEVEAYLKGPGIQPFVEELDEEYRANLFGRWLYLEIRWVVVREPQVLSNSTYLGMYFKDATLTLYPHSDDSVRVLGQTREAYDCVAATRVVFIGTTLDQAVREVIDGLRAVVADRGRLQSWRPVIRYLTITGIDTLEIAQLKLARGESEFVAKDYLNDFSIGLSDIIWGPEYNRRIGDIPSRDEIIEWLGPAQGRINDICNKIGSSTSDVYLHRLRGRRVPRVNQ